MRYEKTQSLRVDIKKIENILKNCSSLRLQLIIIGIKYSPLALKSWSKVYNRYLTKGVFRNDNGRPHVNKKSTLSVLKYEMLINNCFFISVQNWFCCNRLLSTECHPPENSILLTIANTLQHYINRGLILFLFLNSSKIKIINRHKSYLNSGQFKKHITLPIHIDDLADTDARDAASLVPMLPNC